MWGKRERRIIIGKGNPVKKRENNTKGEEEATSLYFQTIHFFFLPPVSFPAPACFSP